MQQRLLMALAIGLALAGCKKKTPEEAAERSGIAEGQTCLIDSPESKCVEGLYCYLPAAQLGKSTSGKCAKKKKLGEACQAASDCVDTKAVCDSDDDGPDKCMIE